jgi:hypothetical protein
MSFRELSALTLYMIVVIIQLLIYSIPPFQEMATDFLSVLSDDYCISGRMDPWLTQTLPTYHTHIHSLTLPHNPTIIMSNQAQTQTTAPLQNSTCKYFSFDYDGLRLMS